MEEGPLIRVVGLLTTSDHKVNELTACLSMYGVGVVKLDPACDYVAYLESSTPKFKILLRSEGTNVSLSEWNSKTCYENTT